MNENEYLVKSTFNLLHLNRVLTNENTLFYFVFTAYKKQANTENDIFVYMCHVTIWFTNYDSEIKYVFILKQYSQTNYDFSFFCFSLPIILNVGD